MIERQHIKYMTKYACDMLKQIISTPSTTFNEDEVAKYIQSYLSDESIKRGNLFNVVRIANNIASIPINYDSNRPTLLLNAHCDTVTPAESYTLPPFEATEKDGTIYGLGSNDDGGSIVALTQTFLHFIDTCGNSCNNLNIILLISAEEERSGGKGISLALKELEQQGVKIDWAIIGEPTGMEAAVAERGLLVLDGLSEGVSGHAARNEGVNAIYKALEDIGKLLNFKFDKHSELMGDVKLSVTQINAGTTHNVIPDKCTFVVDIRPTEQYTNAEIWNLLQNEVTSSLKPRNLKNRSSATPSGHLLLEALERIQVNKFISPTTSDWMRLESIPAIKMGPGDSSRSHKADEYIHITEIEEGISTYIKLIETIIEISAKR